MKTVGVGSSERQTLHRGLVKGRRDTWGKSFHIRRSRYKGPEAGVFSGAGAQEHRNSRCDRSPANKDERDV